MKYIIILLIVILLFSGCLSNPPPRFDAGGTTKLDFNPASFEVIKKWNEVNSDRQEFALDNCNMAYRLEKYKWEINLAPCD